MSIIRQLVENKPKLDYPALCKALIQQFGVSEPVSWDSILPAPQQQELFGGEVLRFAQTHPELAKQKDIRPISLKKGSISQLLFFYVTLSDNSLPKKQIEQITKRFIKGAEANRYIIWFFGNREETALKVVLSGKEGKKVVLKTLPFIANEPYYKTYDFILNEVQSKVNQLFVEPTDLWRALWKAFDISIVNKNFYKEIKETFDNLIIEISRATQLFRDEPTKIQFSIRLIGRIIFCWFLKRKGIIDNAVLSSTAVKAEDSNYYHSVLEILFFDVFNTPLKDRKKKKLPISIADYPFLNGGLFDDQPTDFKGNWQLQISNEWFYKFFNNTLEKYNFTVDENSSVNAEIAIDPEMLGRIFENLLAEQVDETKKFASDRKATGSFYTPREIVDYMVETSIVEYLQNFYPQNLHEDIQEFVHEGKLPDSFKNKDKDILSLLAKVKVIDPACGSGAFPMGVLQKITQLKTALDKQKSVYKLKLETIEQSIFGIDIQPMATELSRLRCWLSLIVDEDLAKVKPLPNLDFKFITATGVVDLGFDSFLQKAHTEGAIFLQPFLDKVEELKKIRAQFFEVSTEDKQKDKLKADFEKLQKQLFVITVGLAKTNPAIVQFADKLLSWNPFDDSKAAPFFSKTWMFGVEDGFDIVIGNPPYIKEYTNRTAFDGVRDSEYYQGKMDLWYLFACRFLDDLKPRTGVLTFIATNNWVTNSGASKFRNKIASDVQILQLIDFGNYKIFESADIQTMILVCKRHEILQEYYFDFRKIIDTEIKLEDIVEILESKKSPKNQLARPIFDRTRLKDQSLLFSESSVEAILNLLDKQSNFKLNGDDEVAQGIVPNPDVVSKKAISKIPQTKIQKYGIKPGDGVFVIKKNALKDLTSKEVKILKPLWEPNELRRFFVPKKHDFELIYFTKNESPEDYPHIVEHLKKYKEIMEDRRENKQGRLNYFNLHWPRDSYFFEKGPKILAIRKCETPTFAYTEEEAYVMMAVNVIRSERISMKFLTALLNSKVIAFWLRHKGKMQGFQYQVDKEPLLDLPLINPPETKVLENIVDYILFINENIAKPISSFVTNQHLLKTFEDLLNVCVYELYFEEHMKEKGMDILSLTKETIKSLNHQKLKEEERRKIINDVYTAVSDSKSEIRNRMLLIPIESKEVLLPIQKIY